MPVHDVCRPPPSRVYLTIGQDLDAIQAYLQAQWNATLHAWIQQQQDNRTPKTTIGDTTPSHETPPPPRRADVLPVAFMAYTDLQTLTGLEAPADYGSGVEYAWGLAELAGGNSNRGLQLGVWLSGREGGCRAVVNGTWTGQVQRFVQALGRAPFYRVFVRLGYEFDNPSFGYADDPEAYRQAWCMIVHACRQHAPCHDKALFVWHSWAAGVPYEYTLHDFYPGDDVVDWMGVSIFQQVFHPHGDYEANSIWSGGSYDTLKAAMDFGTEHDKPIMIAESTPFGWNSPHDKYILDDPWGTWFQPVLGLLDTYPSIAMWSYIDCNWKAQPMWHNVGFGDTRVAQNATVQQLWQRYVVDQTLGYGSLDAYCGDSRSSNRENSDAAASGQTTGALLPLTKRSMLYSLSNGKAVLITALVLSVVAGTLPRIRRGRRNIAYQTIP